MAELTAVLTGVIFLVSFIGWGKITEKAITFKSDSRVDIYVYPVLGMSVVLIIGGYLNLFQLVNNFTIVTIILIGSISFFSVKKDKSMCSRTQSKLPVTKSDYVMGIMATVGTTYVYISSSLSHYYNQHDDFEGYFSFANKLVQTGSLGNDPFSARRMVSSLGGQSFLDSLILTFNSSDFLHVTDSGLGLLILLSSTFSFYRMKGWKLSSISILIFAIASTKALAANVTSVYTLSAIIFVLITFILSYDFKSNKAKLIPFFVIASAGSTLKNSALLVIVLFSILYLVMVNWPIMRIIELVKNAITGFGVSIFCLLPWCIAMYLSNGTFLYPLLGKGFHGSNYGSFNYSVNVLSWEFFKPFVGSIVKSPLVSPILIFSLVIILLICLSKNGLTLKVTIFIVFGVIFINYLAIAIGTANYGAYRYSFPFLFAFTIAVLQFTSLSNSIKLLGVMGFSLLVSAVFLLIQNGKVNYYDLVRIDLRSPISNNVYPTQSRISIIQEVIPSSRKVLLRTGYNFLFNFKRNELLIADYPGESSPPPGIPLFSTPQALRSYLLELDITYLIFQHSGLFDIDTFGDRLTSGANPWLRVEAENALAFKDKVLKLADSSTVMYRDSEFIVIDLNK